MQLSKSVSRALLQKNNNIPSAHLRRIIPVAQLLSQALVECHRTSFGAAVVGHFAQRSETGHAGDGNHMSMVLLDHAGQEFLDHPEMRHCVDFECRADLGLWFIQNGSVVTETSVVHKDRRIAMVGADLLGDFFDVGAGGDVGFVE